MTYSLGKTENRLIKTLSRPDLELLGALEPIGLKEGEILEAAAQPTPFVYFIDSGAASVVSTTGTRRFEVGVTGFEGMTGLSVLAGAKGAAHETLMLTSGTARKIESSQLRKAVRHSAAIQDLFIRYAHYSAIAYSKTAVAAVSAPIEVRIARWLLNVQDRLLKDDLRITHARIADALAVRRPSVTLALRKLDGGGLVKATRNLISIADRAGLIATAGDFYGSVEAEYRSLIGPLPRHQPQHAKDSKRSQRDVTHPGMQGFRAYAR